MIILIIEIAIGVFIGGLLLIKYDAYIKNRDELIQITKDRDDLLEEIKKHIDTNYQATFDNYIKLFEGRLLTLEDEEDVHFKDVGVIEYDLFIKNLDKLKAKIDSELTEHIYAKINADSFAFVKQPTDYYLQNLISIVSNKATALLCNKLLEINEKNTANNAAITSNTP